MATHARLLVMSCMILATLALPAWAGDMSTEGSEPEASAGSAAPAKAPPLPFLCIEGYAGGAITPMAYLCNAGTPGEVCSSLPSAAYTFINMGSKKLQVVSVTQVFWNRLELGYAYNYLDTGSLYDDIAKAGLDMGRDHVQLHHFNARFNILPENSFDLPLPAVTAGVHFKYNDAIKGIDKSLGGALKSIGYEKDNSVDYTLTASKMFPTLAFGRPVILTGGLRYSNASQLGLLGFGGEHNLTFEGNVACLPLDNICLAYEFREKNNPYSTIATLVDREDNWHALSASWIVNDRLTVTGIYGLLGNIANARADCSLGIQVKYEF
ncbi:MAG: DUF3034 family protein [Planctomycetes bacterium]|nr:DUF3034 family protein [Planctomycetota bacterium]